MYVCLSVCVCARMSQKPRVPNFTKFSVHVTCGEGSVLLYRMASRFHIMDRIGQNQKRRVCSSSTGGATGQSLLKSDCILLCVECLFTSFIYLSYGIVCVIVGLAVFVELLVTDRQIHDDSIYRASVESRGESCSG